MRKVYYIYNPRTQTYDRIYPTVRQRALSILRRLFIGMGLGAGSCIVLLLIFGSPSEKELRMENSRLLAQYNVLSRRLDDALGVLQDVQQRDDNLYRVILQADPVSPAIRKAGYGGTNRYEELMDLVNSKLVVNTTQKLDLLTKQLYIQSKSFDDVVAMCKNQDEMLRCMPAIQPISNKDLKKTASGYGTRIDPIYGTAKSVSYTHLISPVYITVNSGSDHRMIKCCIEVYFIVSTITYYLNFRKLPVPVIAGKIAVFVKVVIGHFCQPVSYTHLFKVV